MGWNWVDVDGVYLQQMTEKSLDEDRIITRFGRDRIFHSVDD